MPARGTGLPTAPSAGDLLRALLPAARALRHRPGRWDERVEALLRDGRKAAAASPTPRSPLSAAQPADLSAPRRPHAFPVGAAGVGAALGSPSGLGSGAAPAVSAGGGVGALPERPSAPHLDPGTPGEMPSPRPSPVEAPVAGDEPQPARRDAVPLPAASAGACLPSAAPGRPRRLAKRRAKLPGVDAARPRDAVAPPRAAAPPPVAPVPPAVAALPAAVPPARLTDAPGPPPPLPALDGAAPAQPAALPARLDVDTDAPDRGGDTGARFAFPEEFFVEEPDAAAGELPPYVGAFDACPAARLQDLPRRMRAEWAAAARAVALAALAELRLGNEAGFAAGVRLFLELPARALAVPKPLASAARAKAQRVTLRDLARGVVPPLRGGREAPRRAGLADTPVGRRPERRAKALVEQGLLSKAMRVLESGPAAEASPATLERLAALHPPNPTPKTDWPALPVSAPGFRVNADSVAKVVAALPRGTASGPSAWTFELVAAAFAGDVAGPVAALLTELVCRAAEGRLCWRGLFTASRLVALAKPDGGVRPIAVGEALYRLIGRVLLACDPTMASRNTAAYVGPHQYGVSFPGGVEAPIHAIRELCGSGRARAVLSLDWANAYNSVDRVHTAHEVAARAPSFAPFYAWSYRADSVLVLPAAFAAQGLPASILSRAGVRQGDVLGPLFFSLGAAPTIDALAAIDGCHPWAYLDDIDIVVKQGVCPAAARACVAAVFETAERVGGLAGLRLNRAKCLLWAGDAEALVPYPGACATTTDGLKLLGAPVGTPRFVAEGLARVEAKRAATLERVAEAALPLQHRFLLLRQCVTQVPTFWARTVPGAAPALAAGDAALLRRVSGLLGVPVEPGSLQERIARLPVRLGGMGLRAAADQADRAFGASLLFAAAVARERAADFPCSAASAKRVAGLLPELAAAGLCHSPDGWHRALDAGDFPRVERDSFDKAQHALQGAVETARASALPEAVPPRLRGVFQDASLPGSGAWLIATPSDPTLVVPDEAFLMAARSKLLCPPAGAAHVCAACSARPIDPAHAWSCASLSILRTARHDEVVRRVRDACRRHDPRLEHPLPPVTVCRGGVRRDAAPCGGGVVDTARTAARGAVDWAASSSAGPAPGRDAPAGASGAVHAAFSGATSGPASDATYTAAGDTTHPCAGGATHADASGARHAVASGAAHAAAYGATHFVASDAARTAASGSARALAVGATYTAASDAAHAFAYGAAHAGSGGATHAGSCGDTHAAANDAAQAAAYGAAHAVASNAVRALAGGATHAFACGTTHAAARDDSHAVACGATHARAGDATHAVACGAKHAGACGATHTAARDDTHAVACGATHAVACGAKHAGACGATHTDVCSAIYAVACGAVHADACGATHAVACGAMRAGACGATHTDACGATHAVACGATHAAAGCATRAVAGRTTHTVASGAAHAVARGTTHAVTDGATRAVASDATHAGASDAAHAGASDATHAGASGATHFVFSGATHFAASGTTCAVASDTTHLAASGATRAVACDATRAFANCAAHAVASGATHAYASDPVRAASGGAAHTVAGDATRTATRGARRAGAGGATCPVPDGATHAAAGGAMRDAAHDAAHAFAGGTTARSTDGAARASARGAARPVASDAAQADGAAWAHACDAAQADGAAWAHACGAAACASDARGRTAPRRGLRADLWLPATATAVDVVVTASGSGTLLAALRAAEDRKRTRYSGAVADGTIARVAPFAVGPFGSLGREAKDFLGEHLGGVPPGKAAKARLRISLAAVRGTGRLAKAWAANMAFLTRPA